VTAATEGISSLPPSIFELLGDEGRADPYALYRRIRSRGNVTEQMPGLWAVCGRADGEAILRSRAFLTADLGALRNVFAPSPKPSTFMERMRKTMLMKNPPDHMRLRRLVSRAFTPHVIETLRPRIEQLTDLLLDNMEGQSSSELISEFAFPLPVLVIAELLGVPANDRDIFRDWARAMVGALDLQSDRTEMDAADAAGEECEAYLANLVAKRRTTPKDDLLSLMVAAEDDGQRLTEDELLANAMLLLLAGHETTVNLIGNGVLSLLRNPGQAARLRNGEVTLASTIEELLRYESPVQLTVRRAAEDTCVAGATIPAGGHVVLLLGAINRDPEFFASPDQLDVGRADNDHLAFGDGSHICLGASLARLEGQIAVSSLVKRFPDMALFNSLVHWREQASLRGLKELRVAF
jgi:cytochrome P450